MTPTRCQCATDIVCWWWNDQVVHSKTIVYLRLHVDTDEPVLSLDREVMNSSTRQHKQCNLFQEQHKLKHIVNAIAIDGKELHGRRAWSTSLWLLIWSFVSINMLPGRFRNPPKYVGTPTPGLNVPLSSKSVKTLIYLICSLAVMYAYWF